MARNGFKVLDSDMHIMEPPDLWQRYIEPEYQDRAPRGSTEIVADLGLIAPDGGPWGRVSLPRSRKGHNIPRVQSRWKEFEERGWTGGVQLEAMDAEGIDVAVLYPSRGLFALSMPDLDPQLAAAIARAYNNWLFDFCQADPQRLIGAAMLSPFDVDLAIAEARRCVTQLGFKGVYMRPNIVMQRNWHDAYYDPLWSALEELNVPLGFHEGSGTQLRQVGDHFGDGTMLRHVVCHPLEMMLATTSFCAGGILVRHPELRVAFLEGNCGWAPFLLWRMDEHYENLSDVYPSELTMPPSAYFKRQCFLSVEADETPAKYVIADMGDGRLVYSTDFPHFDSKFPNAVNSFLKLPLSDENKRHILWDNCAGYYGLGD